MNLRKIAMQNELTGNNHQQTLFAEEVTAVKSLYPPDSKRQEIEDKFENLIHEELKLGYIVSYVGNKNVPFLRIYRYKEAFAFDFVMDFLRRFEADSDDYVFDPFSGLGTTLFTSMICGIPSVGIDKLPIAYFSLEWNRKDLGITNRAWKRVIHRGIKPVRVFAHPKVLIQNPKRIGYYRMLAMVSQKSMSRVGLSINRYEGGKGQLNDEIALHISKHVNKIVSILIEHDEKIDDREFDLWRGMAAGSQAQGSWQNTKGDRAEVVIKDLIERRIREKGLVLEEVSHGKGVTLNLKDGRQFILGHRRL
ncbi:hypothetical protein DRN97_05360 [Methanosarcinales archaeon]|nr:MAG: hypothetical protein DRN97_05360 [Methanosarcinales archaeon]